MTPGKFLRLVWPDTGFYCVAHPFKPEGSATTTYVHKVFATISEAVTHVHEMQHRADTFFAVLSLAQAQVWNPEKDDPKTGQKGAFSQRTATNMHAAKAAFFDLDVGPEAHKYPTQRDALQGLVDFLGKSLLPQPTLVSSGGGVHAYWHYAESISRDEWRLIAWRMRQLAEGLGLKVDPMRTTDSTSVLRVPDTYNWKDRANPRPVKVLQEGAVTPVELFRRTLSDAMVRHGIAATDAPERQSSKPLETYGLDAQTFNDFGPKPTLEELGAACAQVRAIVRSQTDPSDPHYGPLDNTAWYRGMLATVKHVDGGDDWCRKLTALHPRTVADTDAKLLQLEQFPPARCATLQQYMPWKDSPCQGCRHRDKVPNPFVAARLTTPAPPPGATLSPGSEPPATPSDSASSQPSSAPVAVASLMPPSVALLAAMIPNPPRPYERLKTGQVAVTRKDKDGNETTTVILEHDLYPLKRLSNKEAGTEQQVWRATLPRSGPRDFVIDADVLYDSRKFCVAVSNNGIYPHKAEISALQDYMVAYINQLQKSLDADIQRNHLGWADDLSQFVLPDKVLRADGTVLQSALSTQAERAAQHIRKAGTLQRQVELMRFYDRPEYIPNQYVVLNGLASILFHMTGHHGIVVNCSGAAGASKSTSLYTAASLWGHPKLWPLNGTNRGATANARMQRVATNANLPTCVDEITNLPARDAVDLVMGITQPGHRLRLTTDGTERKAEDGLKSAVMITTANSSLHSLISMDNASGTAGSMRVFEMRFHAQRVHSKAEADEYLRELEQNYGHIGEIFAQFVVRNQAAVAKRVHQLIEEIDTSARIRSSERFWSADVAVCIVAGEISRALHLLPYDPAPILDWAVTQQIPYMRGVVGDEYRDPLAVLTDYIAEKHGNIVVIDKVASVAGGTTGQAVVGQTAFNVNTVNSALLGHYDLRAGVLYLLKQGFKDHCSRIGASASRIIEDLHTPIPVPGGSARRIVLDRQARRTLGAGTAMAKGQVWCFAVDMTHPDMSGIAPLQVVQGGAAAPGASAGGLVAVK